VFDHVEQKLLLVAHEIPGERDAAEAQAALDRLEAALGDGAAARPVRLPATLPQPPPPVTATPDGAAFRAAVASARERIAAGDIFQVVLARRFVARATASPLALYRALRRINPSPYMVLLELPEAALVGASPEALVRLTGNRVVTR